MDDKLSRAAATNPIVRVAGLNKQVASGTEQLVILHDVNLSVAAGESLAIVGASGSGKSTLLGLLAGLDLPTSGSVEIDGEDLSALDEDARAALRGRKIGFVFQSFQLLPALTALENVALPLELGGMADAEVRATDALARVGLNERLRHFPRTLSGGEQQRVAIARAFATGPVLLFADEPTGNLDTTTGGQIVDLLFALNRERGTTLVLVTHDARLAARCSRSIEIVAGRIATTRAGTPELPRAAGVPRPAV